MKTNSWSNFLGPPDTDPLVSVSRIFVSLLICTHRKYVLDEGLLKDPKFLPLFQIALASFYEDGGDEDIVTISQATPSSVSRGTAPR